MVQGTTFRLVQFNKLLCYEYTALGLVQSIRQKSSDVVCIAEQAPRVDRPPSTLCYATSSTLPATQRQRWALLRGVPSDVATCQLSFSNSHLKKGLEVPKVQFNGHILPSIAKVTLTSGRAIRWESPDIDLVVEIAVKIENSAIQIDCDINRWETDLLVPVYMRALDICRASVNLAAFSRGYGLRVHIDSYICPSGIRSELLFQDESLPPLCTAFQLDRDFDVVHDILMQCPPLFSALNDLIAAITIPHVSAVNCARAIETIKHLVAPESSSDAQAWQTMRDKLAIDRSYLQLISDHSTGPRHGRPGHIPGDITTEITRRSWVVMNRFLEYLKAGKSLPHDVAPIK